MTIPPAVVAQFRRPHGLLGRVAGSIMAIRPSNRRRNLRTVELLRIRPNDGVLEIGCGPGLALAACAENLGSGMAIGLDHSETMLAPAEKRNRTAIVAKRVQLWRGDLNRLSTLFGELDKVFSVNVVQFFEDRAEAFRTLYRVCVPGGLVASTYQPRHSGASRDDALRTARKIEGDMEAAGFIDIRCEEIELMPLPAVCVLGKRQAE
jgi:cyclopropane fatty-acyl-phospholipid synthase-like methyltransferase